MKSDDEIRDDVIRELCWDLQVPGPDAIGVAVSDGAVALTGHTVSYTAERAARRVYDVKAVANSLGDARSNRISNAEYADGARGRGSQAADGRMGKLVTLFGCTAMCEQAPTGQLVSDLEAAEQTGLDFSVVSDQYFPSLEEQGHAAHAWGRTRRGRAGHPPR